MYIAIIFITLTFIFIILNIINNKKISLLSFLFFIILVGYYICYIRQLEIYYKFVEKINNIDLYFKIFCIISMITAFLEYLLSYKRRLQKNIKQEEKLGSIKQEEKLDQSINDVLIFVELHDEPIGYLSNNMYIINNKLKKIINYDNNVINKQDFYNYINYNDKFKLNEKVKNIIFRFKHNNEKWFELISLDINNNEYKLIRPTNINRENQKINLKTYKDLNNDTKHLYKEKKEFYLIFISINNLKDIVSYYGKDFSEIVLSKYLLDIYNLPYIFEIKIYYISKTEYVILLEDRIEYDSLLSELEDNISIITNDDITISNVMIKLKSKVGIIKSKSVNNSYAIINKGYDMMQLASSEDYPYDFVIYHEVDAEIDFDYDNIDIDLDLNKYKQRMQ